MGRGAITVVLIFLLVLLSWQTIYSSNRDLVRVKAWGDLARRILPFLALLAMAASLFIVQSYRESWVMVSWMVLSGVAIVAASALAVPALERAANKAFRSGDYKQAADLYGRLAEEKPLARNRAFLGAALGASERYDDSLKASTKAIDTDPQYGLAYYNRALVLRRMDKKTKAVKDLEKAQEVDLPRRFRSAAKKILEELK